MAENYTILDVPVSFKEVKEANQHLTESVTQDYDNLIDALPIGSFGERPIRLYQGFWFPESIMRGVLAMQNDFQSRPTDLFLMNYPGSGMTWLKAVTFAVMSRTNYSLDKHPLLTSNPHQCVATTEFKISAGRGALLDAIPSPRILTTHLPYSILPNSITDNCRMIYISRDPKDVLVAQYHLIYDVIEKSHHKVPFEEVYDILCDGATYYGPIWDHISACWKESTTKPEKILFLKYEEMLQDTAKHVKRIAEFVGCPFSEAEEKDGVVDQIVALCSFQNMKDLKVNKTKAQGVIEKEISYAAFFRKGLIGDWSNHMTLEMAERLDAIAEEKFKGYGLEISKVNAESSSDS